MLVHQRRKADWSSSRVHTHHAHHPSSRSRRGPAAARHAALYASAADQHAPGHPAAPQPAAPSLLPRNPALTRVMQAMDPVLERAWQLTDTALQPAADTPPAPAADAPAPRVANHFHVNVALGSDTAAGRDPQQLQDALAALLRDAARRQGLDV